MFVVAFQPGVDDWLVGHGGRSQTSLLSRTIDVDLIVATIVQIFLDLLAFGCGAHWLTGGEIRTVQLNGNGG